MICPPPGSRWLLLGDSYGVGLSRPLTEQAAACGIALVTDARVGTNVSQWADWAEPLLAREQPDYVLISQGGNDFGRTWARDAVAADIDRLLGLVAGSGARPLWISPPTTPFPDAIGARQMWWARVAEGDGFDSTQLEIPRAPGDPLGHPTGGGYRAWAAALWPWAAGRATPTPLPPDPPTPTPTPRPASVGLVAAVLPFAVGSLLGFAVVRWGLPSL
jgi:lysophospholipase L1-like esterase